MEILHTKHILKNVLDFSFTNVTYSGINRSTAYNSYTLLFCLRMNIRRGSQGLNRKERLSPRQPPSNYQKLLTYKLSSVHLQSYMLGIAKTFLLTFPLCTYCVVPTSWRKQIFEKKTPSRGMSNLPKPGVDHKNLGYFCLRP